jgi:hypothetical protein
MQLSKRLPTLDALRWQALPHNEFLALNRFGVATYTFVLWWRLCDCCESMIAFSTARRNSVDFIPVCTTVLTTTNKVLAEAPCDSDGNPSSIAPENVLYVKSLDLLIFHGCMQLSLQIHEGVYSHLRDARYSFRVPRQLCYGWTTIYWRLIRLLIEAGFETLAILLLRAGQQRTSSLVKVQRVWEWGCSRSANLYMEAWECSSVFILLPNCWWWSWRCVFSSLHLWMITRLDLEWDLSRIRFTLRRLDWLHACWRIVSVHLILKSFGDLVRWFGWWFYRNIWIRQALDEWTCWLRLLWVLDEDAGHILQTSQSLHVVSFKTESTTNATPQLVWVDECERCEIWERLNDFEGRSAQT